MSQESAVTSGDSPSSIDVVTAYDHLDSLVAKCWGADMHYGYWSGVEDDTPIETATEHLTAIVVGKLGVGSGDRVLDLGCGKGRPAATVARTTGAAVMGVDINDQALDAATTHARSEGVTDLVKFRRCDALELPFSAGYFDAVLAFVSTAHFDIQVLFREIARVIRPGGRVVLETTFLRVPETADIRRRMTRFLALVQIASLDTFDAHVHAIRDSGLELVEFVDITEQTHGTFDRVLRRLRLHQDDLADECGPEGAELMIDTFLEWSKITEIGSMIMVARKPGATPKAS